MANLELPLLIRFSSSDLRRRPQTNFKDRVFLGIAIVIAHIPSHIADQDRLTEFHNDVFGMCLGKALKSVGVTLQLIETGMSK